MAIVPRIWCVRKELASVRVPIYCVARMPTVRLRITTPGVGAALAILKVPTEIAYLVSIWLGTIGEL